MADKATILGWIRRAREDLQDNKPVLAFSKLGKVRQMVEENDAVEAILFSLTIDDHYDMRSFLEGWTHGSTEEWPEFDNFKNKEKDQES